jgi:hypothetical protein
VKPFQNATLIIQAGTSHRFVCQVRGTKRNVPMVWTKDDVQIKTIKGHIRIKKHRRKSILDIKKLSIKDSGIYGCHARDVSQRVISMYAKLDVEGMLKLIYL